VAPRSLDPDYSQPGLSGPISRDTLRRIGAPESSFHIDGLEFYDQLSFLKGGLIYASHLTTVSSTYAKEITQPELGCGLEGLLRIRSDAAQLTGIVNGIDESWTRASVRNWRSRSARAIGRQARQCRLCARAVRARRVARADLRSGRPAGASEGIDLVLSAADEIIDAGGQIVVTGSGEPEIEQALVDAHRRRPDAIGVTIGFNDGQARRIFAGSDFTLMPRASNPAD